jgi:hypothetical protein
VLRRSVGIAAAAVAAFLAVIAAAVAATPSAATMTLQAGDIAGAKTTHSGSVDEKGYLTAYDRELVLTRPFGAGKIAFVENEVAVAQSATQPSKDLAETKKELRSKAGRASLVAEVAKTFKVKKTSVAVGALRGVPGFDDSVELPISVKTKQGNRVYWNTALLRLDRVLVLLIEVGTRPIARGDTANLGTFVGGHIKTALTPVNVSLPTIAGTPQQGQTLTAAPGTWSVDDVTIAYQWQHCDAAGANCTDVTGATQSTYAVTAADVGFTIRVNVTATDRFGAPVASSAPTAVAA